MAEAQAPNTSENISIATSQEAVTSSVYVRNLRNSIDVGQLNTIFSRCGQILRSKIALNHRGKSMGYGFVHFQTSDAAQKAVEEINGTMIKGKIVTVLPFAHEERNKTPIDRINLFTKVHVNNMGPYFSEANLWDMFEICGKVKSCKIVRDICGVSKGYGYVDFKSCDGAVKAIKTLNGKEIANGKPLYVAKYQSYEERLEEQKQRQVSRDACTTVYVKNLDDSVEDDDLRKHFSPFGTIKSARVMKEDGRSKGFGFVCFTSAENAAKAIKYMNGKVVFSKPLFVSLSQSKECRQVELESRYRQSLTSMRMVPAPRYALPAPNSSCGFYVYHH